MKLDLGPSPLTATVGSAPTDIGTLVSLAAVTWGFRLVGRTRMLTEAWLQLDQPTLFVQVPSYRTALQRVAATFMPRQDQPVVRPWPTYPARWWGSLGPDGIQNATRTPARALRRQLDKRIDWDNAVALVVSPIWEPWLDELPFGRVIYDCIDELQVHVKRPELTPIYVEWENRLLDRAAGAVATAESLRDTLHARRPDLPITLIRNGVDVERFQHLAATTPRPVDLPAGDRPIVGFVGALYEWVDWQLIENTIRALPEYDFVFVGPEDGRGEPERLANLANAYLLGPRPYDQVPAYVQASDVCWVPFKQDAIGKAANPVKIYEYLALGKPVVTTPVADTNRFEGVVTVVTDAAEAIDGLRAACESTPEQVAERVAFARRNTWQARARDYCRFINRLAVPEPATA